MLTWRSRCFLFREPSVDTVTSYFGSLPSSYYTMPRYSTRTRRKRYRSIIRLKLAEELSLNSIIIDVTGNTLRQNGHDIVLSHVTKNFETSPKLLLISFLSGSNIWAAFKIPRQRLLLINACTADQSFNAHSSACDARGIDRRT